MNAKLLALLILDEQVRTKKSLGAIPAIVNVQTHDRRHLFDAEVVDVGLDTMSGTPLIVIVARQEED